MLNDTESTHLFSQLSKQELISALTAMPLVGAELRTRQTLFEAVRGHQHSQDCIIEAVIQKRRRVADEA
jgi:hypothetical protein